MTQDIGGGASIYRAPLGERTWRRLGFGNKVCPGFDDVGTRGDPRWAPGEISTTTVIVLDWADRLRALFGAAIVVDSRMRTDALVAEAETRSVTSILPPGAKLPGRARR